MANSLQDQLLKAGVASRKQAQKAKQARSQSAKAKKHAQKTGQATNTPSEVEQKIAAEAAAKQARDKELNQQREAAKRAKELQHSVAQIIDRNRIRQRDGEDAYNFTLDSKIQRVYVTEKQRKELAGGLLSIVAATAETFELVPAAVGRRLAEKIPERVYTASDGNETVDADDPYAEYEIPDDLMW